MPGADNTIDEVDQFMVVKNVCKFYEQFTRLFAPYTVKKLSKLSKLTCFVTQYLTENSKDWVSISCLHVKITDVRIETFQNKKIERLRYPGSGLRVRVIYTYPYP
jgi:hypothetical protein